LGLRTLSIIKELEEMTDECFSYEWLEDESIYDYFREGQTEGIFQLEKQAAKDILNTINTDSFEDVVAASSLNRPGPLSMQMHVHYGENKNSGNYGQEKWSDFTNKTYGTIIYQEQITRICKEIAHMSAGDADKVMKFMKGKVHDVEAHNKEKQYLLGEFLKGAKKSGMSKSEAEELFESLIVYSFNQGHATGYSLISFMQMYYKKHFPNEFWYVTLKYASNESDLYRLKVQAVKEGNIILIPHVNYGSRYSIVTIDGEDALAEGISNIKGVGEKAATAIENEKALNGKYKSKESFIERNSYKGSPVNKGVIKALEEAGALVFDKAVYFERVKKWNSQLYMMGVR
jgi:DNA polymerase-3 subunit alpha